MNFHVLTLFPEMIENGMNTSITGRAIAKGLLSLEAVNIRDFAEEARKGRVDDYPYGGGAGMVMQAEPVFRSWEAVCKKAGKKVRTVYLTPQGKVFDQKMAVELAKEEDLCLLCGHYEGIDERVLEEIVTDPVSIGDYVLTGGELPAMVMMDAISRMVPGVLTNAASGADESFSDGLLEYPQYSRPEVWHDKAVPAVLLSGHHGNVDKWRREQSILRTRAMRPELLETAPLTKKEEKWLDKIARQEKARKEAPDKTIRMAALDLDGTTLLDDKEISTRVEKALRSLIGQGIEIVIASGRALASLPESILRIKEIHYAVTSNGASVYDIWTGERLHGFYMNPDHVRKILELVPENIALEVFIDGVPYGQEDFVANPEAFGLSGLWPAYIQKTRRPVPDIRSWIYENIEKLDALDLFIFEEGAYRALQKKLHYLFPDLYITSSSKGVMEFSGTKEGKKDCVKWIAEKLQVPQEEIIAFGDGQNDMDMLRYAGVGVAMGNAEEKVKDAADFVTLTNLEDGLAVILEEVFRLA